MMAAWSLASQTVGGDPIPVGLKFVRHHEVARVLILLFTTRHTILLEMRGYIHSLPPRFMNIEVELHEPAASD